MCYLFYLFSDSLTTPRYALTTTLRITTLNDN